METIVIILCILTGVSIISLGAIASLQVITGSRERRELQKLLKARDLPEFVQYSEPEEEIIDEDQNLVEIENMGQIIAEGIDKAKIHERD